MNPHITHHINITALRASDTPSPLPQLIADLVDGVLRIPGLRVQRVDVLTLSEEATITKRVKLPKGVPPLPKKEGSAKTKRSHLEEVHHKFLSAEDSSNFCICGREKGHDIHTIELKSAQTPNEHHTHD